MNYFMVNDSYRNEINYDGNSAKFGITVDGVNYIVKDSKSDDFSVYSEYICSNFIKAIGIECQTVYLGIYEERIVNVIVDFSTDNTNLRSYADKHGSSFDLTTMKKGYIYDDILQNLASLSPSREEAQAVIERFWEMMIADAIIGNRDRHGGNWGYLIRIENASYGRRKIHMPAPIYDNGAGLFPNICNHFPPRNVKHPKSQTLTYETDKDFMFVRTIKFPACLLEEKRSDPERTYRTNYYQKFEEFVFKEPSKTIIKNFLNRIKFNTVLTAIHGIVQPIEIEEIYKYFYCKIICLRYLCILCRIPFDEAYEYVEQISYLSSRRLK